MAVPAEIAAVVAVPVTAVPVTAAPAVAVPVTAAPAETALPAIAAVLAVHAEIAPAEIAAVLGDPAPAAAALLVPAVTEPVMAVPGGDRGRSSRVREVVLILTAVAGLRPRGDVAKRVRLTEAFGVAG
ncbi:hypothetical protein [Nocardia sp. NPDC052316]|uniref:hypothetical protein n=1 Tax=Nocardia sp. NPDC052316 TaxID=3364329 RepID=UPI0037CA5426